MNEEVICLECGEEVEGQELCSEYDSYTEYPEDCPHCGCPMSDEVFSDDREDFCRGT